MITPDQIMTLAPVVLYVIAHIIAIFGKPKFVENNKFLNKIADSLAANYGNAKNAE